MNKSLFKRATAIAAASALALSATLIVPLLSSAVTDECPICESTDKTVKNIAGYVCDNDSTHNIGARTSGTCGHAYGICGGTLSENLACANVLCDDPTGTIGDFCTNDIPCPGKFVPNCDDCGTDTPRADAGACTRTYDCKGTVTLKCANGAQGCNANIYTGTEGTCPGEKRLCMGGTVFAQATCSANHTPVNSGIGDTCGADIICTGTFDGSGICDSCGETGGTPSAPCGEALDTCDLQILGECPTCGGTQGANVSGACDVADNEDMEDCGGARSLECSNICGSPTSTLGVGACTYQETCNGTVSGKCNAAAGTGCEGVTTPGTIGADCTSPPEPCGGMLSGLGCNNPKGISHSAEGTFPGECEADLGTCAGDIESYLCNNAWHTSIDPDPSTPSAPGNGGGESSSGGGGGSVVADMIAGGGIGGGGGTNNTESGGGGKEVKVIADSAEAKLAVGNATRGTVTLSPDMGATSDVLEALTTVGANVKVWIPHGTHGVAIKGSDLGEGELKDLSFKGGAVAVPESIKSSFPEAKSITGMGFVESGDFGGVDQVMLSVRLDLDPKLWGSPITVYSVGEDGSLTKLEASRIVSGNGMVNVTITNYNSLIFVV
ncbi:MAG: hypothetical protein FWG90_13430 [Oscillospiraceae bacterium]|nr:hypothetical protein [Oscillospiraceae bacterium]